MWIVPGLTIMRTVPQPARYPGVYHDGRLPQGEAVGVVFAPHGVAMDQADGSQLWWPFEHARVTRSPQSVRIESGAAWLLIDDPAAVAAFAGARAPGVSNRTVGLMLGVAAMLLIGGVAAFLLWGFPWLAGAMAALVPVSAEERLGRATLDSLAPPAKRCVDPTIVRMARALARQMPDSPYTFRVFVAEDPMVNAFAAPGGYVVMFRGLLDRTRRPEEAAAVLAHEMQHVAGRHTMRGLMRGLSLWVLLALITGNPGDGLVQLAGTLGALHYQRGDENEADAEGVRLLAAAGVDPRAMAGMLEMLDRMQGDLPAAAQYFSSHPLTADRIARVRELAAGARLRHGGFDTTGAWPPPKSRCAADEGSAAEPAAH